MKSHNEVLQGNAGALVSPITFVEARLAHAELEHQTRMIAAKLEAAGWSPRRSDAGSVVAVGLLSGSVVRDGGWRNTNVLPAVAKRNRADLLAAFGLWLKETPHAAQYCRYCVISSGVRCSLEDLPDRLKWFNGRLGRFVEKAKANRWGVDVQLITIEITFSREADGTVSCNPHANIVYWPKRAVGPEKWGEFLRWMRKHFKVNQIEDTGRLAKPEEMIKYALKPAEVMQLTSDETRFLAETLHRKQIVRTVGSFGTFCSGLRDRKEKVRFDRQEKSWCRIRMRTREQAERDAVEKEQQDAERNGRPTNSTIENQLLYQTLPQARTTLLAESFVGVRNYTPTPVTDAGRLNLAILEERRAAFVLMLVEKDVQKEAMATATSRLDTCTKIPLAAAIDFMALPENRRRRILRQAGVSENLIPRYVHGGCVMELSELFERKLERLLTEDRHPWAIEIDTLIKDACQKIKYRRKVERFADAMRDQLGSHLEIVVEEVIDDDCAVPASRPGGIRERAMKAALARRRAEIAENQAAQN